jgi:LemA protein
MEVFVLTWLFLAALIALSVFAIVLYNGLVKKRQMVEEGWSGIDVQLKRRANLIPNLVETVKGYASHEKEALEAVTRMRTAAASMPKDDVAGRAKAEGALGQALGRLFAVAEAYPDLKANQNFSDLHQSLDEVEDAIQMARRYYNGAVRNLNVAVESFPSNLVANQFKFEKAEYFEIEDEADRAVPKVEF